MADKKYKLKFQMTDGTEQSVEFAIPVPDKDEIVAEVLAILNPAPAMISFSIDGVSYQAEEGMTWRQWCDSEYNVAASYFDTWYVEDDGDVTDGSDTFVDISGAGLCADQVIEAMDYGTYA